MEHNFYFKNVPEVNKQRVNDYFQKRIQKITKLLSPKDLAASSSHVSIEYHEKHNCFTTGVKLEFPFSVLHGQEDSHDILKTIDLSLSRLHSQFKKQKARIRPDFGQNNRHHQSLKTFQRVTTEVAGAKEPEEIAY